MAFFSHCPQLQFFFNSDCYTSESDIMKCDRQYSGLEQFDLCSGKLKLITPALGFPLDAQP